MATNYILSRRAEKRMGAGKWPKITTWYLSELPPIVEYSRDRLDATILNEIEAQEMAHLLDLRMERV